jgi:hypothetical protein
MLCQEASRIRGTLTAKRKKHSDLSLEILKKLV